MMLGRDNNKSYTYDNVFNPESSQQNVFDESVSPMIDYFIGGFNVSIMAYGQTGSGKTYTIGMVTHLTCHDMTRILH